MKTVERKSVDLSEMNKLEEYLKVKGIPYERYDDEYADQYHQICVPDAGTKKWDAICHRGSYGWEQGLLEIAGSLVNKHLDLDTVVGYLTAEDVIKRIESKPR